MRERKPPPAGPRLTIERSGHQVTVDARGLCIDGWTVDPTELTPADAVPVRPTGMPDFNTALVLPGGEVIYRGRVQARLHPSPPGTANPGRVEVYQVADQRPWPPPARQPNARQPRTPASRQQRRADEEADRLRREDHLLAEQRAEPHQSHEREITR
ncbi:hypothetical protein [Kitasatospora sp. KL5]|uniref:hypothetical protein n=1 Tax=Kitasatospora sp. KL5 TaxID=3425125 RepID=UPI003D6ECB8A